MQKNQKKDCKPLAERCAISCSIIIKLFRRAANNQSDMNDFPIDSVPQLTVRERARCFKDT